MIKLEHTLHVYYCDSKDKKTYRNPIIYAQELQEEMRREGLSQAEFARKHGISRARVNQWLSLLKLPQRDKKRIMAMGDHWSRQLLTERQLRSSNKLLIND